MTDALSTYEPKGSGLFLKIRSDEPVTLRVLTLDPLVSIDQWGGTRYSFVVWNWNEGRAQVLNKGAGILKQFTAIHRDEDVDPLNKLDVKITATGEGLETRYTVMPLPKARELTRDMVDECTAIKLEDVIENGTRLSKLDSEETNSGYKAAKAKADEIKAKQDVVIEDIDENTDVDLNDIPF